MVGRIHRSAPTMYRAHCKCLYLMRPDSISERMDPVILHSENTPKRRNGRKLLFSDTSRCAGFAIQHQFPVLFVWICNPDAIVIMICNLLNNLLSDCVLMTGLGVIAGGCSQRWLGVSACWCRERGGARCRPCQRRWSAGSLCRQSISSFPFR